jgi:hypothetical protein
MTRTISLITATVGAAFLFAVPAYGDSWGADKAQPLGGSPELVDLLAAKNGTVDSSIAGNSSATQRMLDARELSLGAALGSRPASSSIDAREAALTAKYEAQIASTTYPDWFERAAAAAIRDNRGVFVADDRFDLHPQQVPVPVSATATTSSQLEWPQVGIGFGVGLVLILGLLFGLKATHTRPFAH